MSNQAGWSTQPAGLAPSCPMVLLLELRHRGYEIASRGFLFTEIPDSLGGSHLGDRVGAEAEGE
jgi:hypothetical protein